MASIAYQQRHQRLLAAARQEFVERGFCNAKIHRICTKAGLGVGTFYSHFDNKMQVLAVIMEAEFATLAIAVSKRRLTRSQLRAAIEASLAEGSGHLRHTWVDAGFERLEDPPNLERLWLRQLDRLTRTIREIRNNERIHDPPLPAPEAARLLLALIRERGAWQPDQGWDRSRGARLFLHHVLDAVIVGRQPPLRAQGDRIAR